MSQNTERKASFFARIEHYMLTHKKQVGIGAAVIVVAVGGWFAYKKLVMEPKGEEAVNKIAPAEKLFEQDSFALVNKGPKGAASIADAYSGTKAGNIAAYMAGVSYLQQNDPKKAAKYLEEANFDDRVVSVMTTGLLGDTYLENGDKDKALSQYLKAAKQEPKMDFPSIYWYKKAARIYESQNKWQEALDIYETIKKDFKDSEEATDISKYISRAEVKLGKY